MFSTFRKYYKEHLDKYTAIQDDYMKKYKSMPLAIELEKKLKIKEQKEKEVEKLAQHRDELLRKIKELEGYLIMLITIVVTLKLFF